MKLKHLAGAVSAAVALSFAASATPTHRASAHAPIEWSDPKADAVVPALPKSVKVRFAEEPLAVRMRSVEPEPRKGMPLEARRIGERTYEVDLPSSLITPEDNTVVIYIEADSKDGHTAGGIYLLHVESPDATTTTRPVVTSPPSTLVPPQTSPPAVFTPPVSDGPTLPTGVIIAALTAAVAVLSVLLHKARRPKSRTQGRSQNSHRTKR